MLDDLKGRDAVVHVVDDDGAVRDSTCSLIESAGYRVVSSPSGNAFLERQHDNTPGCVILDLQMPGMSGLDVIRTLRDRGSQLSVVVVTGHADVKTAVEAMQLGATDFLEKPYAPDALLDAVERGITVSSAPKSDERSAVAQGLIARLTPRECEVLRALLSGGTNKSIAREMNISPRTVEMHRDRMMTRLNAKSLSEALRIAYEAGLQP